MTSGSRQQFNVYLDPELVRATKRACLDRDQTLSEFVADALRAWLQAPPPRDDPRPGELEPVAVLFVRDMRASLSFCRTLGLRLHARSRNGRWAELDAVNGRMALHAAESEGEQRIELSFESHGPLEPIAQRLSAAGFKVEDIVDEGFGRSLCVRDPNGLPIQLNELDPDMYA